MAKDKEDKGSVKRLGKAQLNAVEVGFERFWKAHAFSDEAKKKYSLDLVIDMDDKANKKAVAKAIKEAEQEIFGKTGLKYKEDRTAYREGDEILTQDGEQISQYVGKMVVKAKNEKKVKFFDKDGETELEEDDDKMYRGVIVNAIIRFYCIKDKKKGGNGLFCILEGVQYKKKGERIGGGGGGVRPGEFANESDEDEDDEDDDEDDRKSKKSKKSRDDDDDDDDDDDRKAKKSKKSKKSDDDDDDDDDDFDAKKSQKGKKGKKSRYDDDDDDDDDDDEDDKKSKKSKSKKSRDDDDDDDDDDEDDRKSKKSKKSKKSRDDDDDDDDDDE